MWIFHGFKIGGLQQKIFNLMFLFVAALIGVFITVSLIQQRSLTGVVEQANKEQQSAITEVSEGTMDSVIAQSLTKTTALQAYIADDLFSDVKTDVSTLHSFATQLFINKDSFHDHAYEAPKAENDGKTSVQMQHEEGVDPADSEYLGLIANMSEIMSSMFENSDKLGACFVATTDGCILFVNDRSGVSLDENGNAKTFPVRQRQWYIQAKDAGKLIFTGVEEDYSTGTTGLVCAAPVFYNGEVVAVVGADIFLTAVSDYVNGSNASGGFICIVNEKGQVIFSPNKEGTFKAEISDSSPDLRDNENEELANFVKEALEKNTGLKHISVDGKEYYLVGVPMATVGWAAVSAVEVELTHQPTEVMLANYESINEKSLTAYRDGAKESVKILLTIIVGLVVLAIGASILVTRKMVRPIEHMTTRINSLSDGDTVFEMEKVYKTGDEIEILAQSFVDLSSKTRDYIAKITDITAEKERIGTELALATRIQADMLPNTYPAFPDRPEFDIYASMDPAREVGGDFYDFFLVDDDHLCMLIADVSGKGIPAALFMMASRIILASNAKLGKSPAEILEATNSTICQNNREEMFVTVWLGILEISTGKLTAANAGHEYPVVMQAGEKFELYKDKHGFVIGGMDGMKYKEYEINLKPGSKLFIYTDGVPEATNAENQLFGTDRMTGALNEHADATCEEILKGVRGAVDEFVKEAEQFDDLTMLCMEYKGEIKK